RLSLVASTIVHTVTTDLFSLFGLTCSSNRSFFFSSRRRHTRSYGDWSSDVCSSDLVSETVPQPVELGVFGDAGRLADAPETLGRSEERRVGKECSALRSRSP